MEKLPFIVWSTMDEMELHRVGDGGGVEMSLHHTADGGVSFIAPLTKVAVSFYHIGLGNERYSLSTSQ